MSSRTFIASSSALGEGMNITLLESGLHSGNQEKEKDEQAIGSILENAPAGEGTSAALDIGVSPHDILADTHSWTYKES